MLEIHNYQDQPEPGFEERLFKAIDRYFVRTPKYPIPIFSKEQLLRDHPAIAFNPEFMQRIEEAVAIEYERISPSV